MLRTKANLGRRVYDRKLRSKDIELLKPSEENQKKVTRAIMSQLAGKADQMTVENLLDAVDELEKLGAEAVLIACTDLPPILKQKDVKIPLIDCTKTYADRAAQLAAGGNKYEELSYLNPTI